jgi:hypothetical protein
MTNIAITLGQRVWPGNGHWVQLDGGFNGGNNPLNLVMDTVAIHLFGSKFNLTPDYGGQREYSPQSFGGFIFAFMGKTYARPYREASAFYKYLTDNYLGLFSKDRRFSYRDNYLSINDKDGNIYIANLPHSNYANWNTMEQAAKNFFEGGGGFVEKNNGYMFRFEYLSYNSNK